MNQHLEAIGFLGLADVSVWACPIPAVDGTAQRTSQLECSCIEKEAGIHVLERPWKKLRWKQQKNWLHDDSVAQIYQGGDHYMHGLLFVQCPLEVKIYLWSDISYHRSKQVQGIQPPKSLKLPCIVSEIILCLICIWYILSPYFSNQDPHLFSLWIEKVVCLLAVLKLGPLNSAENPALHMQMRHDH